MGKTTNHCSFEQNDDSIDTMRHSDDNDSLICAAHHDEVSLEQSIDSDDSDSMIRVTHHDVSLEQFTGSDESDLLSNVIHHDDVSLRQSIDPDDDNSSAQCDMDFFEWSIGDHQDDDNPDYGNNLLTWAFHQEDDEPLYDMSVYDSSTAHQPLYKGSETSLLDALVQHFLWFSSHPAVSKQALSDILYMQHHSMLPKPNCLPDNYDDALKFIEPFLVKPIIFHACPNDCILYRGEHKDLSCCPICQEKRYTTGGIPRKRFTYLPIGPRLERLFGTSRLSELIQCHSHVRRFDNDYMFDIHDSPMWKKAYSSSGQFKHDSRGIALGFCTDGVNPYQHNRVQYSMWPIVLALLNLPRHLRYLFNNLMLVGIIPGNGSKEPTIDAYLDVVVDEILALNNRKMYDAYKQAPFQLKLNILLYTLDYPGIVKTFHIMGAGAYSGCAWCEIKGTPNAKIFVSMTCDTCICNCFEVC